MPLVSVIIPTYQRPEALARAIASALHQTWTDFEIVVVVESDDVDAVRTLSNFDDPRLRCVVSTEKNGSGCARDVGVGASRGQWIAFLDDDDEWLPEKLEKQLGSAPDVRNTISMTQSYVVSSFGTTILPTQIFSGEEPIDEWMFGRKSWFKARTSMVQTSSLMVPRSLFTRLQFGPDQHEEWELVIRAVKECGYQISTIPEPLVIFYVGRTYPWERSTKWIDKMRGVVTPRAYSGFCLTIVTQGLKSERRNYVFLMLLKMSIKNGQPTIQQLLAFLLVWCVPHDYRQRLRATMRRTFKHSS